MTVGGSSQLGIVRIHHDVPSPWSFVNPGLYSLGWEYRRQPGRLVKADEKGRSGLIHKPGVGSEAAK